MKGQGGGGTAKGGGKTRSGGGSVSIKKTKARQTKAIDDNILVLRSALFDEKGKDKDVTAGILGNFLSVTACDQKFSVSFASSLNNKETEWAFQLVKDQMEAVYDNSGYGWDDDDKFRELTEQGARFLMLRNESGKLCGFVHFRFTVQGEVMDQMAGLPCLYVIDFHIEKSLQRHGLGKHLLVVLELIGRREKMTRVCVPVFNGDSVTRNWLNKIGRGFALDESFALLGFDPAMEGYEIFSKVFPAPATQKLVAPVVALTPSTAPTQDKQQEEAPALSLPAVPAAPAAETIASPPKPQDEEWVMVETNTLANELEAATLHE